MSNITEQQVQTLFDTMMQCQNGGHTEVVKALHGMEWIATHSEFLEQFNNKLQPDSELIFIGTLLLATSGFIQLKETN